MDKPKKCFICGRSEDKSLCTITFGWHNDICDFCCRDEFGDEDYNLTTNGENEYANGNESNT